MKIHKYEIHLMRDQQLPFILKTGLSPLPDQLPNWHENLEILYCTAGTGTIQYNGKHYRMEKNDLLVINTHVIHLVADGERFTFDCLILDTLYCESSGIPLSNLYFQELIHAKEPADAFQSLLQAVDICKTQQPIYGNAAIRARLLDLMCVLCRDHSTPQPAATEHITSVYVKSAVEYIRQHYAEPLTLEQIAQHVGISKFYLAREFKGFTGRTVFEIIRSIRCKEARRLIEQGISVSDAAQACGFDNPSYFTRVFKKCFRYLPSHYIPKNLP